MKRLCLLALCCLAFTWVYADGFVSDEYNRNSLSLALVQRGNPFNGGDQYDNVVTRVVTNNGIPAKFDVNDISDKQIWVNSGRSQAVSIETVTQLVEAKGLARQIIAYEFCRQSDGTMSDELILKRGNYNATDQDYVNAMATKVGLAGLSETGHNLLNSTYLVVMDFYNIYQEKSKDHSGAWRAYVAAHVFHLDLTDEDINYVYENCWIYDDDSESVRQQKRSAFEQYNFRMGYVTTATGYGYDSNLESAIAEAYTSAYNGMDELVASWRVATTIQTKHPLSAKIGTKEGLKNGDRYRSYSYRQNEDGEIVSVKHGYLRATVVANNSNDATGNTETSKFYQISGVQDIRAGWAIKQDHDAKTGIGLNYAFNGGLSVSALNLDIDYLFHINRIGCASYILVCGGTDLTPWSYSVSNFKVNLGLGYGIPLFTRQVELMPYATLGMEYMNGGSTSSSGYSSSSSSSKKNDKRAYFLQGGGRLAVTLWYPVQVYAKLGYDVIFSQGTVYQNANNSLPEAYRHKDGLSFAFGIRVAL